MDAIEFVRKWAASKGSERQTSQEHFIDLCRLLGEQTPNEADPVGSFFAFEKGAKTRDGDGFADVWLDGNFAWEYKGKRKDLNAAYGQVQQYREALGNPPLLVVCDLDALLRGMRWRPIAPSSSPGASRNAPARRTQRTCRHPSRWAR